VTTPAPNLNASNASKNYLSKGGNTNIILAVSVDANGNLITRNYDLWITSFATSSQTQFSSNQTQKQIVYVPIRRSEMMINFSIDWPLQTVGNTTKDAYDYNGFKAMHQFHNDLRRHQQLSASTVSTPPPMSFIYSNNYHPSNSPIKSNSLVNNNLSRILDYSQPIHTKKGPDYKAKNPVQKNVTLQPLNYQGWILQVGKEYDRFKAVYSVQYVMNVLTPADANSDMPSSIIITGTVPPLLPTSSTVLQQGQNWTRKDISMGNGININRIPG